MSIVALKRKSKILNTSVSDKGFSLNGGYRNQGWVGQSSSDRHILRTPFRGSVPMGHGGNNGSYNVNIINSNYVSANNPNIIKSSTKTAEPYMNQINECNTECNKPIVKNFPYTNSPYNIPSQNNNIDKVVAGSLCNTIKTDAGKKTNCRNCNYFKTIKPLSQSEYIKNRTSCNKNN